MSVRALQDYTFNSKYARYNPAKKRRDTWNESINRVMEMHIGQYPQVEEEIRWAFEQVRAKRVLGSQRALQYAGYPVISKNARVYNCCVSYCDRIQFFQESLWLLLCGCGVGFSVQTHHVAKLPDFHPVQDRTSRTWTVEDSIEGWADALGILLATYMPHDKYQPLGWDGSVEVLFDYSQVREKGALLSSGVGKAPGPEPLMKSLEAIRNLLERCLSAGQPRVRSIDAYDIVMHASDAVLSGGVRRSATICLFSPDDELMAKAKTGDWFYTNPQRGRSNNSALLVRDTTTREQFHNLMQSVKQFGEPGFVWSSSTEMLYNPCFHPDTRLSTDKGSENILDMFNSGLAPVVAYDTRPGKESLMDMGARGIATHQASAVKLTQKNAPVYEVVTEHGAKLKVTANHKFPTLRGRLELRDMEVGDTILLPSEEQPFGSKGSYEEGLMLGILTGDGTLDDEEACVDIWKDDFDVLDYVGETVNQLASQIPTPKANGNRNYGDISWVGDENKKRMCSVRILRYLQEKLGIHEPKSIKRRVPECVWQGSRDMVRGYLQGFFFADGTVLSDVREGYKPTFNWRLCQSNEPLLREIQQLLGMFAVVSRIYPARPEGDYELPDGKGGVELFHCRANFELVVNRPNAIRMFDAIGAFGRKSKKVYDLIELCGRSCYKPERYISKIKEINYAGDSDVYCLEQDLTNTVIANGLVTGQCVEIGMYPVDIVTLLSGWSFCNLCEINGKKCKTPEDFARAAKAAAIIGTLQAGYTDFGYLGETTKRIVEYEALLGVSITGMMDSPDVLFNPEVQRQTAELVKQVNEEIAAKIGIRPAARATCVKPSGSTSLILGTASGIHAHHSHRYIRRVQANMLEAPYQFFATKNPRAVEKSVWSKNGTDSVIAFCVETSEGARTRKEVNAVQLLEYVKLTQQNWVTSGKTESRCAAPWLSHNVSNTITVRADEWDGVEEFIFDNREYFAGISLLSQTGDLDYPQAPFTAIHTPVEIVKLYGDGSLMASGLIVDGLAAFNDNLWRACDAAMGYIPLKELDASQADWVRRAAQYSERYFSSDMRQTTYCLKEVSSWKLWCDLNRETVEVDYSEMIEDTDETKIQETVACAGGFCEL
jgi:intein/homing endonuclease